MWDNFGIMQDLIINNTSILRDYLWDVMRRYGVPKKCIE